MQKLELRLRTLTPLWTGDISGNSSHIRETGLLGSLRWWYEGIIRGMGGSVCDPLAKGHCEFKQEKPEPPEQQLCPACLLFGCTGWQRRFRLEVTGLEPIPLFFVASSSVYQTSGNWLWRMFGADEAGGKKQGRGSSIKFTLGVQALWGTKTKLRIIPLKVFQGNISAQIAYLLNIISKWGALGAKTQNGFGQVIVNGLDEDLITNGCQELRNAANRQENHNKNNISQNQLKNYFDLGRFFSRIYEIGLDNPYGTTGRLIGDPCGFNYQDFFIPCAFDIRYKSRSRNPFTGQGEDFGMRPWFKNKKQYNSKAIDTLFGKSKARTDEDRSGGRIGVSHLYRKQRDGSFYVKIWGHVPNDLGIEPEDVAREIDMFVQTMFRRAKLRTEFRQKEVLES